MLLFEDKSDWLNLRIEGVKKAYLIPDKLVNREICIDIGSNVGAFPIVYNKQFNRIICIEPSKYSYNECIKNNATFSNVEVYNYAVYKTSGETVKLKPHKTGNVSGNASIIDSDEWDENNYELIQTISLDDFYEKFNFNKINYLKIDCEGGEYDFLSDKDISNIDCIAIEIHIQLGVQKVNELISMISKYFNIYNYNGDGINSHYEITFINKKIK